MVEKLPQKEPNDKNLDVKVDPRLLDQNLIGRREFLKIIGEAALSLILSEKIAESIETTSTSKTAYTQIIESTPIEEIKEVKTQIIYRGRPGTKKIAFTIDDALDSSLLKYLLELAINKNIKMVWFLIGRTVNTKEADLIKEALNTGLVRIGNHSLNHNIAQFSNLELGYLREEIEGWLERMKSFNIPEKELLRYFRPPGGVGGYNGGDKRLLELLSKIGYSYLCMWDIEFIYTIYTRYRGKYTLENVSEILRRNIYRTQGGNLILFHFNPVDLSALRIIADKLLVNSYQFVFPEELLS
jgi:peptidoglycan/xylan/chitin deacetylase (PgdA/CDA1 family)